jgi:hypothetical protein
MDSSSDSSATTSCSSDSSVAKGEVTAAVLDGALGQLRFEGRGQATGVWTLCLGTVHLERPEEPTHLVCASQHIACGPADLPPGSALGKQSFHFAALPAVEPLSAATKLPADDSDP